MPKVDDMWPVFVASSCSQFYMFVVGCVSNNEKNHMVTSMNNFRADAFIWQQMYYLKQNQSLNA